MKVFGFSAVLLMVVGVGVCDINAARKDALKKIEDSVLCIIKVGNDTNQMLTWKPNRIESMFSHSNAYGQLIRDSYINELQMETKMNYLKADAKGCLNPVYNCIATSSNNGEYKMKTDFSNFYANLFNERTNTASAQKTEVDKWTKEINKMEEDYRKNYATTTFNIVNAKTEAVINSLLQNFSNATKTFEAKIKSINTTLDTLQYNSAVRMQALTTNLMNTIGNTMKATCEQMNRCFGSKLLLNLITNQ